jgi:hypothetical protein
MLLVFKYYSNWMTVFNFYPMTHTVNTALYLSNWGCFFGNLYLMIKDPLHLDFLTKDLPFLNTLPLAVAHVLNNLWHVLPLYLFRKRQTLAEIIAFPSIVLAALFFFVYGFSMPASDLMRLYNMTQQEFLLLGVTMGPFIILFLWTINRLMRSKK